MAVIMFPPSLRQSVLSLTREPQRRQNSTPDRRMNQAAYGRLGESAVKTQRLLRSCPELLRCCHQMNGSRRRGRAVKSRDPDPGGGSARQRGSGFRRKKLRFYRRAAAPRILSDMRDCLNPLVSRRFDARGRYAFDRAPRGCGRSCRAGRHH